MEELTMLDSDETAIQNWLAAKEKLAEQESDQDYDASLVEDKARDSKPRDVADLLDLSPHDDEHRGSYRHFLYWVMVPRAMRAVHRPLVVARDASSPCRVRQVGLFLAKTFRLMKYVSRLMPRITLKRQRLLQFHEAFRTRKLVAQLYDDDVEKRQSLVLLTCCLWKPSVA